MAEPRSEPSFATVARPYVFPPAMSAGEPTKWGVVATGCWEYEGLQVAKRKRATAVDVEINLIGGKDDEAACAD